MTEPVWLPMLRAAKRPALLHAQERLEAIALSLHTVLLLAIVTLVNLTAGWLLGRLWPHGRSIGFGPDKLRHAARRLAEQVACVSQDIHQHQGRIHEANQELLAAQASEGQLMPSLLASVAEIVRINAGLQSKLSAAEETLEEQGRQIESWSAQALTDPLTGLPNRRAFDDAIARRLAEWHRTQTTFSIMLIDADYFKKINDRYGHPMGDFVLRRLAEVLETSMRKMDLIARIGGEEFAVILPSTTSLSASRAAQHCHAAVADYTFGREEVQLRLTVSIGIASVAPGDDAESLLRRADEALYAAKHAGRNCIFLHDGRDGVRVGPNASCEDLPREDLSSWGSCHLPSGLECASSLWSPDPAGEVIVPPLSRSGLDGRRDLDEVCRELRDRAAQLFRA